MPLREEVARLTCCPLRSPALSLPGLPPPSERLQQTPQLDEAAVCFKRMTKPRLKDPVKWWASAGQAGTSLRGSRHMRQSNPPEADFQLIDVGDILRLCLICKESACSWSTVREAKLGAGVRPFGAARWQWR